MVVPLVPFDEVVGTLSVYAPASVPVAPAVVQALAQTVAGLLPEVQLVGEVG